MAALLFLFAGQLIAPSQVIIFILFIGVVTAVLGFQAMQRMRDFLSGKALVGAATGAAAVDAESAF